MFWLTYLFIFVVPVNVVSQVHTCMCPLHKAEQSHGTLLLYRIKLLWGHCILPAGDFLGCYAQKRILSHTELPTSTQTVQNVGFVFQVLFSSRYLVDILIDSFACFLAGLFQPSIQIQIQSFCVFKLDTGLYECMLNEVNIPSLNRQIFFSLMN